MSICLQSKTDLIWVIFLTGSYITGSVTALGHIFTPSEPSVPLLYFKSTEFCMGTRVSRGEIRNSKWRASYCAAHIFKYKCCWHVCLCFHAVFKTPIPAFFSPSRLFLRKQGFEYKKAHYAFVPCLSCSVSSSECFFFPLRKQSCQGQFKREYFFLHILFLHSAAARQKVTQLQSSRLLYDQVDWK